MKTRLWTAQIAGALLLAGAFGIAVTAQTPPAQPPAAAPAQKPKVKVVQAIPIVSVEGKDNYDAYCAVCHGREGKGDGPAAPAMKVPVADLTTIAARHEGKFNATVVENIIRQPGKISTPAHGAEEMPIWGDVFRSEDKMRSMLRIRNLVKYLETIQSPGTRRP